MKKVLILIALILLITTVALGQKANLIPAKDTCPVGTERFPGISTSSLVIEGDCVTPKEKAELWMLFAENMCGETGFGYFSLDRNNKFISGFSSGNHWNKELSVCEYHPTCYINGQKLSEVNRERCDLLIKRAEQRRGGTNKHAHAQQPGTQQPKAEVPAIPEKVAVVILKEQLAQAKLGAEFQALQRQIEDSPLGKRLKEIQTQFSEAEKRKVDAAKDVCGDPKVWAIDYENVKCVPAPKPEAAKASP